ncbi:ABC transporter substrate-binding protein [Brachybacterium sp. YJGR34]|uniref:ABC transporter substrate-binding protein n=1 Tax=Brachybacterium sp. YJGR34 TaxID=2059911 RepID=UPI001300334A|nr:extracellular solute-binding protein [Brachybacterium sp. YJGR34]
MVKDSVHPISRRTCISLAGAGGLTAAISACGGNGGASGGDPSELLFYNQSRGQEAALTKLAEQYSAQADVTVRVETPGPADFPAKLQSKAQSGDMPDIYSALDEGMAPYYKAGWAMDLTEQMDSGWSDTFTPLALSLTRFAEGNNLEVPPGIYSAHWDLNIFGLFVNPETTGVDLATPPATLEDLIDALVEASPDQGLFSVAASLCANLLQELGSKFLSDEEIEATLSGSAPWTAPGWVDAFGAFETLRDSGVIASGTLPGGSDDNPGVEKSFFSVQDVGAIYNGSGAVAVARSTAPDFTDYGVVGLPPISGGAHAPRSVVRVGKGAAINPKGANPEAALAFVTWLSEPAQQKVFAEEAGLTPTAAELIDAGDVAEQLRAVAAGVDSAQAVPSTFTSDVRTAIGAAAQSIVLGELGVDEALEDVQSAQDRSA